MRQMQVMQMRCSGMHFKAIARALSVTTKTIEYHWAKACRPFKTTDPVVVCHWAICVGLVKLDTKFLSDRRVTLQISDR